MGASASRPSTPSSESRTNNATDRNENNDRNDTSHERPLPASRLSSFGRSARPSILQRKSSTSRGGVGSGRRAKRESRMSVREVPGRVSGEEIRANRAAERVRQTSVSSGARAQSDRAAGTQAGPGEPQGDDGERRGEAKHAHREEASATKGALGEGARNDCETGGEVSEQTPLELALAGTGIAGDLTGDKGEATVLPLSTLATPSLPTSPGPPVFMKDEDATKISPDAVQTPVSNWPSVTQGPIAPEDPTSSVTQAIAPSSTLASASTTDTPSAPSPSMPHTEPAISPPSSTPSSTAAPATSSQSRPTRPTRARGLSMPVHSSANQRTLTGRLSAMLGFSAPSTPGMLDSAPETAAQTPAVEMGSFEGLQGANLDIVDDARRSMASEIAGAAQNEGAGARTALATGIAAPVATTMDQPEHAAGDPTAEGQGDLNGDVEDMDMEEMARQIENLRQEVDALRARRLELERQPVGAMLIIQGLAQTQVQHESEDDDGSASLGTGQASVPGSAEGEGLASGGSAVASASAGPAAGSSNASSRSGGSAPRRPAALRRMSDGSLFRRMREQEAERGASLDQQARMIGGLLTVAAAATANTLLQPPAAPDPPARTGMSGAIDNLLNRLRPNRSPRHGIEQALGSYLRNVARNNRRSELTNEPRRNRPTASRTSSASSVIGSSIGSSTVSSASATSGSIDLSGPARNLDFQQFLEDLQNDLVGAVRAFAAYPGDDEDDADSVSMSSTHAQASPLAVTVPLRPIESDNDGERREGDQAEAGEGSIAAAGHGLASPITSIPSAGEVHSPRTYSADPSIPTFHRQLGQNLPRTAGSARDAFGINRGGDVGTGAGRGRTLNFFRAHLFPPTNPAEMAREIPEGEADDTIVPCIFVGVRSVHHEAEGGAEEMMQGAGFPFGDMPSAPPSPGGAQTPTAMSGSGAGAGMRRARSLLRRSGSVPATPDVPYSPNTPAGEGGSYFDGLADTSASASTPGIPPASGVHADPATMSSASTARPSAGSASSTRPGRSFRDRVLARLNRRPPAERPMNTYLVYVVGGNYPRNHPILRIPALLTGGPLTDEEMTLIGELLGPAKPPTATKEDIERSGLRIVKGEDIKELGEKGELHENTVDRCLVCLGDYEEGEECRVLVCKHVYHRECVDKWLEQGANSCPACRNQAVNKTASGPPSNTPSTNSPTPRTRPSLTRGATSIPAPPLHATASGLAPFERPLSVVPESESSSRSGSPPQVASSAPEAAAWGPPHSPVPSLSAPIDVASVPARPSAHSGCGVRDVEVKDDAERISQQREAGEVSEGRAGGENASQEKAVTWGSEENGVE